MATIVEALPESKRSSRHPWDEWLDGQVRLLEPGTDFASKVSSFQAIAFQTAKRRGLGLKIRVRPEGVYIQAVEK